MLHRQRHSSCAVLPRVTPPPGLVADAKFRTQTRFPDFAYAEAASKLLLDETIVLQGDFQVLEAQLLAMEHTAFGSESKTELPAGASDLLLSNP